MGWYSSIPSDKVLDSWIQSKFNALFHGRHGIGKTSMIFDAFKRQGWEQGVDYLYFSAATIDPWVDLIGVPARVAGPDGVEVLKLIRPESIDNKNIKAFFIDELNRSHKKVRNAIMELIQFKSINGLKFDKLEIVWGAVNPDDDAELKYDVEKLDPAQSDRFHVHVEIPYKPSQAFFAERFKDPEMAEAVCKWWNDQPEKVKLQVTPRRLEYAIDVFLKTNELRYVIPSEAHVPSLKNAIQSGNPEKNLLRMIAAQNEDEIRRWLAVDNNLVSVQTLICTNKDVGPKVLHLLSDERLTSFAAKHKAVQDQLKAEPKKYSRVIKDLAENSSQKLLKEMCIKLLPKLEQDDNALSLISLPKRPLAQLNLSARQKTQITKNYKLVSKAAPTETIKSISKEILHIATETPYATNAFQKEEMLKQLENLVDHRMTGLEAGACLKIIENIVAYSDKTLLADIKQDYSAIIETTVGVWARNNKHDIEKLFEEAPYITTSILVPLADKVEVEGSVIPESNWVIRKISNNQYTEIPEEAVASKGQSIDDLF